MCGQIGGGANPSDATNDATKSQWYNACSGGGERTYPYGADYDGAKCNGADYPSPDTVLPVGSATECQGAVEGVHDLSGNVWEWVDTCSGETGGNDTCAARGGAYDSVPTPLSCDYGQAFYRNGTGISDGYVGFRCCSL